MGVEARERRRGDNSLRGLMGSMKGDQVVPRTL